VASRDDAATAATARILSLRVVAAISSARGFSCGDDRICK
jgi:hypothetical protein